MFELGKQYIVNVSEKGIIPIEEFKRERFFDKDHDALDFLTDEEKEILINECLDKLLEEIKHLVFRPYEGRDMLDRKEVLEVFDEYRR